MDVVWWLPAESVGSALSRGGRRLGAGRPSVGPTIRIGYRVRPATDAKIREVAERDFRGNYARALDAIVAAYSTPPPPVGEIDNLRIGE